jgi:hypothetical protein
MKSPFLAIDDKKIRIMKARHCKEEYTYYITG